MIQLSRTFWMFCLLGVLFFTACEKNELAPMPVQETEDTTLAKPEVDSTDLVTRIQKTATADYATAEDEIATRSGCNSVLDIALSDPNFSLLVEAVERIPGLADVLDFKGIRVTLFAPTNAAFEAFLQENGFSALDEVPRNVLLNVLANHLLGGKFPAHRLHTGYARTLAQTDFFFAPVSLYVQRTNDGITLNGDVNVVTADIFACRSVVHVVDKVIALPNIVDFALANPNFSTLVAALTRSDLPTDFVEVLSGEGPFTVLAPTNEAFQDLLDSNPEWNSLEDIPADVLDTVLKYHVAPGNIRGFFLQFGRRVPTLANEDYFAFRSRFSRRITIQANSNEAHVLLPDVQGSNGVIHAIDAVILP